MASDPFLTCGPATSWYNFTYPLAWSNNCEVAEVVSDVPFISVGILAFGVSASFLAFQRVPLSAVWLYFSALLAFVAVILDLGQTLANELLVNTTSLTIWQLIRAREILLALSVGFRFLFYWSYAAEPPRKARPSTITSRVCGTNLLTLDSSDELHGGSWIRWGMPGKLLQIGLLVAITVITALQIVWRVVPQFHRYSNVYATDAALELLVSFLLLLKLLLNTITPNSPDSVLVHTFRECLAPISGVLVNIAIGVGNLLCFAFTESIVGRLLQALEVYIIVVFVMVIAILRHRNRLISNAFPRRSKRRVSDFRLPFPARGSIFRVTPPVVETPRMSMILGPATSNNGSTRETLRRSLNKVSSWVSARVSRNRLGDDCEEVRLWGQSNAEKGKVDPPYTGKVETELRASLASLAEETKEWAELAHDAAASNMSIMSALDAQSAIARSMEGSINTTQVISSPQQEDVTQRMVPLRHRISPPASTVSPNTVVAEDAGGMAVREVEKSPIYALDGIRAVGEASNDSQTSLEELLRQQNELAQSIAALKLFSRRTSTTSSCSSLVQSPRSAELARFSSSTGRRTTSDISLSSFPIPPWLTTPLPSLPSSRPPSLLRGRHFALVSTPAQRSIVHETSSTPPVISVSPVDIPSTPRSDGVPYSPVGEDNAGRSPRFDSGGTQYNVTSFIRGLALPGECVLGSTSKPAWSTESASNVSATGNSPSSRENLLAPRSLERMPTPLAKAKFSLHAGYAGSLQGPSDVDDPALLMQRRINQQVIPSLTVTPSPPQSQLHTSTNAMQDGMLKLPTKTRSTREIGSDESVGADASSDRHRRMFDRPRPPPLVIQSYSDYRPRAPRVQDAGG